MNAEMFAEWLRRQGYQIIRTPSSYWYNAGPRVFQAFPYHWLIDPPAEELRGLLLRNNVAALRFSRPFYSNYGKVSYHVICRPPYDFESIKSHAKNSIRKGLSLCTVEQISFERLATEGWHLQEETLRRQQRLRSMSRKDWEKLCVSASDLPGFEAWATIYDRRLAATVITARIDDVWTIPYAQSATEFLNMHVNNLLFFSVCKEMLSRPGIHEVFTNLQSLDAPESVDEFKFRMNLTPQPVRQQIIFNPLIEPIMTPKTLTIVQKMCHWNPESPFWAKTEGVLRFYLDGKQPTEKQLWPECLSIAYGKVKPGFSS